MTIDWKTRVSFYLIVVLSLLVITEALSFGLGKLYGREIFSREEEYFASVDRAAFQRWQVSPWYDDRLGWNVPTKPTTWAAKGCLKKMMSYFNQDEHRGTPRPGIAAVALFGDSYTYGQEVEESYTTAAALERFIDAPVLNYGVPAASPTQAVLKFERLAQRQELPKVAVLVIMHENIWRVVNSFRPALYFGSFDSGFGMRPYIAGDTLVEAPVILNYDEFVVEAKRRFQQDFWARPRFTFPYSVSLFRAVTSNTFYFNHIASWGRPAMSYEYQSDNPMRRALTVVIDRWRSSVSAKGITPFVLFVPIAAGDRGVSSQYVESLNASAGQTFAFEFEDPAMDWQRYNLDPDRGCHPTPYGYERIAAFIASRIMTSPLRVSGDPAMGLKTEVKRVLARVRGIELLEQSRNYPGTALQVLPGTVEKK